MVEKKSRCSLYPMSLLWLYGIGKDKMNINKQIEKAREELRRLHSKYQKEFFEINNKIDKYLESLEIKNGD